VEYRARPYRDEDTYACHVTNRDFAAACGLASYFGGRNGTNPGTFHLNCIWCDTASACALIRLAAVGSRAERLDYW
jgi:hypothetical protein